MARTLAARLDDFVFAWVNARVTYDPLPLATICEMAKDMDEKVRIENEEGWVHLTFSDRSTIVFDE